MNNTKVAFFGSSVSLRVRPFNEDDIAFPFDIENKLSDNHTFYFDFIGGQMIDKYVSNTDHVFKYNADFLIFNFGINELSSRSVNKRFYNYLNYYVPKKKWKRSIQLVFRYFEDKFRTSLVNLKGKSAWYNSDLFLKDYIKLITTIQNKSNSKIIILGINRPDKRVESHLPGTIKRVDYVNEQLKLKLEELHIPFIDVNEVTTNAHRPDGIHFNAEGHELVSKAIIDTIEKLNNI